MYAPHTVRIGFIALVAASFTGCAATPKLDETAVPVVFENPREEVSAAAADALVVHGFDIEQQELGYVEGSRPHKVGLFIGSGGESVGVWMTERTATSTDVQVQTARSLYGALGQKNWDDEVLDEMRRSLEP